MHIAPQHTLYQVADDHVVILQGQTPGATTQVVALNAVSVYLWQTLQGSDFTVESAAEKLTERYDVSPTQATQDVQRWVDQLTSLGIIEP